MALFCQMSQLLVRAAVAARLPVPQIPACDQLATHGVLLAVIGRDDATELKAAACVFHAFVAVEQYGARHIPKPLFV
ncbi:hypothetical protein [Actinoplanes regularis]|uniref:Uncharacterized protein n=1 Tax=Actinoplanes regularis TaxID=52697 RepID=A0A238WS69_9ACTN|nr:hypothetical protein [Actinoplanes regularis]GIE84581.1 hypothetical protein Are01nite_10610 [Actinoplanes regularis]SNR49084.1 hypothetical protein SAMN06264365_102831 [Actinoplanes regularis]